MTAPSRTAMRSPCIAVCRIEPESGLCDGCLRTLDEIAGWGSMGEARREQVWHELARRKAARGEAAARPARAIAATGRPAARAIPAGCDACQSGERPPACETPSGERRCA